MDAPAYSQVTYKKQQVKTACCQRLYRLPESLRRIRQAGEKCQLQHILTEKDGDCWGNRSLEAKERFPQTPSEKAEQGMD